MLKRKITDWDNAYANMPNIPDGEGFQHRWEEKAGKFRESGNFASKREQIAYGSGERNFYDLFEPQGTPKGTAIIVHGGYWMRFGPRHFSHLAAGPLANGWAVATPSYTLCPDVTIAQITAEISAAVEHIAANTDGPIVLCGHSAGGHLVTRMMCAGGPPTDGVKDRVERVLSISGVHDLRPLLNLELNATLRLDAETAAAESPALLQPALPCDLICWAGAGERAEFLRQNALLASVWLGLGATTTCVEEPDRHHFDVIEGLEQASSAMTRALLGL